MTDGSKSALRPYGNALPSAQAIGPLPPIVIPDLSRLAADADLLPWEKFLDGVDRHWIYRADENGAAVALIRFQPGGRVPLHEHAGHEHIFILKGSQTDETGTYHAGSVVINLPGTRHAIVSEKGCLVLAIYERHVRFLE